MTNKSLFTKPLAATIIVSIILAAAIFVKYMFVGSPVTAGYIPSIVVSLVIGVSFMATVFVYFYISGSGHISEPRFYYAILTILAFTFIINIMICSITPLLMAPAFSAICMAYIVRSKRDIFVMNFAESIMLFMVFVFEYFLTDGDIYMYLQDTRENYLVYCIIGLFCSLFSGFFVSLLKKEMSKRTDFLLSCFINILCSMCCFFAFSMIFDGWLEIFKKFWLYLIACGYPLIVSLIFVPFFERIYNLTTNWRLIELTDMSNPLLKRLINEAPGTYNHSTGVANLAVMCANAIGEDSHMARACALFHDVGKLENPMYFSENQDTTFNPHDDMLPEVSAEIIKKHTTEGYNLCKKYHLPKEIVNITIQHHGTLYINYFLNKSRGLTDGEVNSVEYQYDGVAPRTKIAAIIMICDSAEAAIRSMDNPNAEKVGMLLDYLVRDRIEKKQFDNCPISLNDLSIIKETIIGAFGGQFHKRVKYQKNDD